MTRVVILGARGFVARALTDKLHAGGVPVTAVSSEEIDLLSDRAPAALSALLQPDDALVVPAALTPDKGRDVGTLMKNLRMGEKLCQALTATTCSHLVYLSSDAVYPNSPAPISEETMCSPTDLYALMHIAREQMLGYVARERSIPFCVLRPSAIYGAADTHNGYGPNRFMRTALSAGTIRLFGEGEEQRDHVYIDDVVTVITLALQAQLTRMLNVVTGRAVPFRDVADCVARHVGASVTVECAPRTGPVTHRSFDTARLRSAFPGLTMTSLDDGIASSVAALRMGAV